MNFITEFIMGVVILGVVILGVVAYTIIFNVISRQLNELCERINDLEEEFYNNDKNMEEGDV